MAEKINRQGLTWRHVLVVVTMCLSILLQLALFLLQRVYAIVRYQHSLMCRYHKFHSTLPLFIWVRWLVQLLAGILFDKFNAKTVCCVAAILIIVPYFGFAFYPAIWCYLGCWLYYWSWSCSR